MENNTKDKSLAIINNNNIFIKIRNFLMTKFKTRPCKTGDDNFMNVNIQEEEKDMVNEVEEKNEKYEDKEELERKLINYYNSIKNAFN